MNVGPLHNVFLTGFMGSGKSTVGKLLADLLECPFVDLDEVIVVREGRTIAEIFASDGEQYFRDCETSTLEGLAQQPGTVYATGGGIVVRDENRLFMKRIGRIVYLQTGWSVLKSRLEMSTDRPLIASERDWDGVKSLLTSRLPLYEDADIVIATDDLGPLEVAQNIITAL